MVTSPAAEIIVWPLMTMLKLRYLKRVIAVQMVILRVEAIIACPTSNFNPSVN